MSTEKQVLVVDDDPELQRMMEVILRKGGFEVIMADDGISGLKMAETMLPNLIISDVMMTNMDGMEMCRRLRALPATQNIPIIMLSALGDIDTKLKGFDVGADDYVAKPVNPKELVARVSALLARTANSKKTMLAHTFSLVGAKGGVGVTSVAMNVAARLAQMDYSVILVELRPSGGTLRHLLRFKEKNLRDMSSLLKLEPNRVKRPEVERCLIHHSSGMQVMLSPEEFENPLTLEHIEAIFDVLSVNAQYIIFDVPPMIDDAIKRALQFTDQILLVTEPEDLSVECAASHVRQYKHWGVLDRVNLIVVERIAFASSLNQVEVENKAGLGILEHLRSSRWDPRAVDMNPENRQGVVAVIPPAANAFHETVRDRVPLVMVDPNAKPAHALLDIVDWLVEKNPVNPGHNSSGAYFPPAEKAPPRKSNRDVSNNGLHSHTIH